MAGDFNPLHQSKADKELEVFGKYVIKLAPLWIPAAGIALILIYPNKAEKIWHHYQPMVDTGSRDLIFAFIAITILLIIRFAIIRKRESTKYKYYRIIPHIEQSNNVRRIHEMVDQLSGYRRPKRIRASKGREWFQWMIHKDNNGDIAFYIGCPADREAGVIHTMENAYPQAEFHKAHYVPMPKKTAFGGRMEFEPTGIDRGLPLNAFDGHDGIGNMVAHMEPGTWIDVSFSPNSNYRMRRKLRKAEKTMRAMHQKISEMDSYEKERYEAIRNRLSGRDEAFKVSVSIASDNRRKKTIVHSVSNSIKTIMSGQNRLMFRYHPMAVTRCPYPTRFVMDWTGRELEQMIHLPQMNHEVVEEIPHLEKGERNLGKREFANGITIGHMKHPYVKARPVQIPLDVFKQHFVLTGKTGSGKSAELLMMTQHMMDEWIKQPEKAPGLTVFDPARETVLTILNRLLKAESDGKKIPWEKVHFISMKDSEFPLALNLLHQSPGDDHDTIKNNIMALLDTAFDNSNAPRMQKYLENAILALLQDARPHSIVGINKMLTNDSFRESVVDHLTDPVLKEFWEGADEKELKAVSDVVYNRMSPFQSSIYMRRMFGQTRFGLDLKRWMDEGHIVLIDIKGIGKVNTTLTVGHMITQYHQQAQKRGTGSKLHMLFVDEAHLVQIPIMQNIIAEDRKFGLGLGLMTQYMAQFHQWLRKAIGGNMGTILSGTQGDDSAAQIESMTNGRFTASYLQDLPSLTVAVFSKYKGKSGNQRITTCTVTTDPPYVYKPDGKVANHENESDMRDAFDWAANKAAELQQKEGVHFAQVDEQIHEYLGVMPGDKTEYFLDTSRRKNKAIETGSPLLEKTSIIDDKNEKSNQITPDDTDEYFL